LTAPDMSQFAKYIPGFEFLTNLTRQAAGGSVPGAQSGVPGMPPMSHWVAPTFDVEELDKRIQDLRAVHFWLDQNTKALAATIQALEVQKMTLATLKGMNVSMQEMADAFKIRPETFQTEASPPEPVAPTQAPAAAPAAPEPAASDEADRPAVDPMQWWNALTEQFQTIASSAIKDMADQTTKAAEQMAQTVQATAEAAVAPVVMPAQAGGKATPKPSGRTAAPAAKKKGTKAAAPAKAASRSKPAAQKAASPKPGARPAAKAAAKPTSARRSSKG
jgi:hypothetical protein